MPRPPVVIGRIIEALAKAGVFRLRSVLIGTAAYQTYPAVLG
ncbi:GSU2403 family nucleotidyltransferase fold protein, partial [Streptococcus pneumoniae]